MPKDTFRVVTRGTDGKLHIRDYQKRESLERIHTQIGVDDCSTDLGLRGLPVFRGLTLKTPNPRSSMRSPCSSAFFIDSKTVSTAISALVLVIPVLLTTSLMISSLITAFSLRSSLNGRIFSSRTCRER